MLLKEGRDAELCSSEVSTGVVAVREALVACEGMIEDASIAMLELTSVMLSDGEPWVTVKLVYIFFGSESIVFENWLGDEVTTLDDDVAASPKELNDLCDDVESIGPKEVSTGVVVIEEVAGLCVEADVGSTDV